ncbi:hypothetical protein EGR_04622 [Echinococcus granulosus]|uniref:Uncharacterized protein n=1 Tax=Echinococcus granulosus TaxID=6210 RepID=W6UH92_ECHGR|nr:hypothetical protein EGR_04622 [Echinococcus granulosus]EUB60428.1 hypothetical protein EGR_04622 [Echinococcus granulosus]
MVNDTVNNTTHLDSVGCAEEQSCVRGDIVKLRRHITFLSQRNDFLRLQDRPRRLHNIRE